MNSPRLVAVGKLSCRTREAIISVVPSIEPGRLAMSESGMFSVEDLVGELVVGTVYGTTKVSAGDKSLRWKLFCVGMCLRVARSICLS